MDTGKGQEISPTMTCLPCSGSSVPGLWCGCGCHFDGTFREARFAGATWEWAPECIFSKTKAVGLAPEEEKILDVLREMKKDEFIGDGMMSVEQDERFNELMKRSRAAQMCGGEEDMNDVKKRKKEIPPGWWSDSESGSEGSPTREFRHWYCAKCGKQLMDLSSPGAARPFCDGCADPDVENTENQGGGPEHMNSKKVSGAGVEVKQLGCAESCKALLVEQTGDIERTANDEENPKPLPGGVEKGVVVAATEEIRREPREGETETGDYEKWIGPSAAATVIRMAKLMKYVEGRRIREHDVWQQVDHYESFFGVLLPQHGGYEPARCIGVGSERGQILMQFREPGSFAERVCGDPIGLPPSPGASIEAVLTTAGPVHKKCWAKTDEGRKKKKEDHDYEAQKKLAYTRMMWRTQIEDRAAVEENEYRESLSSEWPLDLREATGENNDEGEDGPGGSENESERGAKDDCDCEIL